MGAVDSTAMKNTAGSVLAVDIGGTFTDFVLLAGASRRLHRLKRPSTPPDYASGLIDGALRLCREAGVDPAEVRWILHGTTVATNALLERKGAPAGLVTTRGFRDAVEIGDQMRPHLYGLEQERPAPLVPRFRRLEVRERVGADGRVVERLDLRSVRTAGRMLGAEEVGSVAVAFLFSHLNPIHERRAARALAALLPGASLSLSCEVSPEHGEIGRFETTVANAYLQPVMRRYLEGVERRLRGAGFRARLLVLQSNGGVMPAGRAARLPVHCLLSGPAAGVVGAPEAAGGGRDLITLDMGGTSTDVSLLPGGRAALRTRRKVGGVPVHLPAFDIETIGAGGGSIASVDPSGRLRVGPESAGADPGPACYARGGSEPTVTDALVVLGLISPAYFLGGEIPLDIGRARAALRDRVAGPLRMGVERAAHGIITLVSHHMARALRVVSVERGYDPRRFALVAYGGAGPLHAPWLARRLEIPRVVIPAWPGLQSAAGLLWAEPRLDRVAHVRGRLQADGNGTGPPGPAPGLRRRLRAAFARLESECRARLREDGLGSLPVRFRRAADLRYEGQAHDLPVRWSGGGSAGEGGRRDGWAAALAAGFHRAHRRAYGHSAPEEPVEVVAARLTAEAELPRPGRRRPRPDPAGRQALPPVHEMRPVLLDPVRGFRRVPVYRREALRAGAHLAGPALVEGRDSNVLVLRGQRLRALSGGTLELRT